MAMVTIFLWAFYVFAVIGMAGVWHRVRHPLPSRPLGVALAVVTFIPIAMSLTMASWAIPRVLLCLSGMACGPSRAAGLLLLAQFGAVVLVTEIVWQIAGFVLSRQLARTA